MNAVNPPTGVITQLLPKFRNGDEEATRRIGPYLFYELHRIATRCMNTERRDHTLQPTALVNEAYLRVLAQTELVWQNRSHFFAVAAGTMRRILVDHARSYRTLKRGSGCRRVEFQDIPASVDLESLQLISLDKALKTFAEIDERASRVVEMRYFGGLSNDQIGDILGVSERTIKRDWKAAKAWLRTEMER